jgi:hypothetical protein
LEVNTQVFTKQDIRKAARDIVTKKWQVRWDSSNSLLDEIRQSWKDIFHIW